MIKILLGLGLLLYHFPNQGEGCGGVTHTEIINRAEAMYNNHIFGVDQVKRILKERKAAFQAGAPFPDSFYSPLCFNKKFHDISEDAHWGRFQQVAFDYFHKTYPNPVGNEKAEDLLAFLLAAASHSVADVSWHNLEGLKDGFLKMLADTSFDGNFEDAHDFGDIADDAIGLSYWNTDYWTQWYIPDDDLYNIFLDYYGEERITKNEIFSCADTMVAVREVEKVAASVLYPIYAEQSSIFQDEFESYFSGGVDDMAAWTRLLWNENLWMAKYGTDACHVEDNPMKIKCNVTSSINRKLELKSHKSRRETLEKKFKAIETMTGFKIEDLIQNVIDDRTLTRLTSKFNRTQVKSDGNSPRHYQRKIYLSTPYSKYGHSLLAADYNEDGVTDLVIGAPGFVGKGRVFFLCGTKINGSDYLDDFSIEGDVNNGGFGWSLAYQDGHVIIGSPFEGTDDVTYKGGVYSFAVKSKYLHKLPVPKNDSQVGTLGWALAYSSKGVKFSGKYQYGDEKQAGAFGDSDQVYSGSDPYDWSGSTLITFKSRSGKEYLAVGSPNHKVDEGLIGAGKVEIRPVDDLGTITATIHGLQSFEGFGKSIVTGNLTFDDGVKSVLVVGSPFYSNPHSSAHRFAGAINIFSLDDVDNGQLKHLSRLDGDRFNGNFGKALAISENNELFASAPQFAKVGLLLGPGRVYRFKEFQQGVMTDNCNESPCPDIKAETIIDSPCQETKGQMFGFSLAICENYLFVGSPRENNLIEEVESQTGSVYMFDILKM